MSKLHISFVRPLRHCQHSLLCVASSGRWSATAVVGFAIAGQRSRPCRATKARLCHAPLSYWPAPASSMNPTYGFAWHGGAHTISESGYVLVAPRLMLRRVAERQGRSLSGHASQGEACRTALHYSRIPASST